MMNQIDQNPTRSYEDRLSKLLAKVDNPTAGFFGPGSATWQVYREPNMALGGLRALLLQIAHPAVATGVNQYSNFKTDTYGRGIRTFRAMSSIFFGDCQEALKVSRKLHRMHSRIKGKANGCPFKAKDPDLLLWVLATLIDTAFLVFETKGKPLSRPMKEQFYEESKITATLMGIPPEAYPKNLRAFELYFEEMINGPALQVNETTLDLAAALFNTPLTIPYINKLLAAGLLSPHLNLVFDLPYTRRHQRHFNWLVGLFKALIKCIPFKLHYVPPWHMAMNRLAKQTGQATTWQGRLFTRLAAFIKPRLG